MGYRFLQREASLEDTTAASCVRLLSLFDGSSGILCYNNKVPFDRPHAEEMETFLISNKSLQIHTDLKIVPIKIMTILVTRCGGTSCENLPLAAGWVAWHPIIPSHPGEFALAGG